jgi:hypothetical protein
MRSNFPYASCKGPGRGLCLGLLAVVLLLTSGAALARADVLAQKKIVLNARLDSLEMEKQNRKRQGRPLAQLDSISATLKDSMNTLKQAIALTGDSVAPATFADTAAVDTSKPSFLDKLKKAHLLPPLPKTMFDWIIVSVAFIAVLSGIVLLFGLLRAFIFRPKKSKPSYTNPNTNTKTITIHAHPRPSTLYAPGPGRR